jgi:hypothetical protein
VKIVSLSNCVGRRDRPLVRPRADQPAVKRDGVEDLQIRAVLDGQPLDDVDAVQLGVPPGHIGQIPTGRRGWTAHPPLAIQCPAPSEDAADGADRGQRLGAPLQEGPEDGLGTAVARIALLGQLPSQVHDQVLDVGRCASRGVRDRRSVVPIDAIQSLVLCPLDPVADGWLTDAEAPRGLVLGHPATDSFDDLTTAWSRQGLLLMATSRVSAVSVKATPGRTSGRSIGVRRRTDVNDRQVVAAT